MTKIRVEIKCPSCSVSQKKTFNVIEPEQPVEWQCPGCDAKTTLNFGSMEDLKKFETKSDYVARVPKVAP